MADPNVLGLNIELQLNSIQCESDLKLFAEKQSFELSNSFSKALTTAFNSIPVASLEKSFAGMDAAVAPLRDNLNLDKQLATAEAFNTNIASVSQTEPYKQILDGATDLIEKLTDINEAVQKFEDSVVDSSANDELLKTIKLVDAENDGLVQVAKTIGIKNRGHQEQTDLVVDTNRRIQGMTGEIERSRKGVDKTEISWGKVSSMLKHVYDGILKSAEAAEEFVTANFRLYGHQEAIIAQTDVMINQYQLFGKTAFKATKALMEEGLRPDKIKETTEMVAKLERVTGVGAEQLAGFVRESEIMGLSVSDTAETLLIYEGAQKQFNLSTAEAATLMKKLAVPGVTAQRMFLKNAQAVREFASTKAQMAGFAKQVGANIGEVIGLFDKLAEGSLETMTGLMAFSGIANLTAGNMTQAFTLSGKKFKEMLDGAGDNAVQKAAIMDSLRRSSGMTTGQIETAIKAYESEEAAIKEIAQSRRIGLDAAKKEYDRRQAIIKQSQELKARDPANYLKKMNGEWAQSTDNLTASYNKFKDVYEALGDVIYQFFMPGMKLIFDILADLGTAIGSAIVYIKDAWNAFIKWAGFSDETERSIRAVISVTLIAVAAIGLLALVFGKGAAILSFFGAVIMWIGGLIMGWLGLTPIIASMGGTFATLGGVLAGFFAALTPIRKTMLMVAMSMALMASSAVILGFAMKQLIAFSWSDFGKGILMVVIVFGAFAAAIWGVSLAAGSATAPLWSVAAAILAMGAATMMVALAIKMIAGIDWKSLLAGGAAILGVTVAIGVLGAVMASVGWIAVAGMLALGAAALMIGAGLYLAANAASVLSISIMFLTSQTAKVAEFVGVIAGLALTMTFMTLVAIPFGAALLIIGAALYAFTWELYACGERIGLFAEQLILFGTGLMMISAGMGGIKAASSTMSSDLDNAANAMTRFSASITAFPLAKANGVAAALQSMAANASASTILNSLAVAIDKIGTASAKSADVKALGDELSGFLGNLSSQSASAEILQKIGSSFTAVGESVKSMSNVGSIMSSLYEGVSRFADIGKIPENLAKVGTAMRKVPGLTAKVAVPPTVDVAMEELEKTQKSLTDSVNALGPLGAQLGDAMRSINEAIPLIDQTAELLDPAVDALYNPAYYMEYAAKWLKTGSEYLSDASQSMVQAFGNSEKIETNGVTFINSLKSVTEALVSFDFRLFYYQMRSLKLSTDYLSTVRTNMDNSSTSIERFARALVELSGAIAGLKQLGVFRLDTEQIMTAADQAAKSVENYKQSVESAQAVADKQKDKKDSQPLNKVQVKTGGVSTNDATGAYDEKMLNELNLMRLMMKKIVEKIAGPAAADGAAASATDNATDTNSYTSSGGWGV